MAKTVLKYNQTNRSMSVMVKSRENSTPEVEHYDLRQRVRVHVPNVTAIDGKPTRVVLTIESMMPGRWEIRAADMRRHVTIENQKRVGMQLILSADVSVGSEPTIDVSHHSDGGSRSKAGVFSLEIDVLTGAIRHGDWYERRCDSSRIEQPTTAGE